MSAVHDDIALKAFAVLPRKLSGPLKPYLKELKRGSWYPDWFADRSMTRAQKAKIDPDADRFIYPDPPKTGWQKKIISITEKDVEHTAAPPLRSVYLINHYLEMALSALDEKNRKDAMKFFGVFSHVIADTAEPIHALDPRVVDLVVPPPEKFIGLELHANIEGLKAKVDIKGYKPKLLGATKEQVAMGAYAGLVAAHKLGSAQAVPIAQALYAGNRNKATALSAKAQNASAKLFADFMLSVLSLHTGGSEGADATLDLRGYPFVSVDMDMLYRYRPMVDISLIPYSGGKSHPLAIIAEGKQKRVKGLGVVGLMAPPHTQDRVREAKIEYHIEPGAYKTFRAKVGLNPLFTRSLCRAVFIVIGDGKTLTSSSELKPGGEAKEITANIKSVRWLTLLMRYTNNPTFEQVMEMHCDWASHGAWANPVLF